MKVFICTYYSANFLLATEERFLSLCLRFIVHCKSLDSDTDIKQYSYFEKRQTATVIFCASTKLTVSIFDIIQ